MSGNMMPQVACDAPSQPTLSNRINEINVGAEHVLERVNFITDQLRPILSPGFEITAMPSSMTDDMPPAAQELTHALNNLRETADKLQQIIDAVRL